MLNPEFDVAAYKTDQSKLIKLRQRDWTTHKYKPSKLFASGNDVITTGWFEIFER